MLQERLEERRLFEVVSHEVQDFNVETGSFLETLKVAFGKELLEGVLFELGLNKSEGRRCSFLFFDVLSELSVKKDQVNILKGGVNTRVSGKPLDILQGFLGDFSTAIKDKNPFLSGAIGFMSYDAVRLIEEIPDSHLDDEALPEMLFKIFRSVIVFDYQEKKWVMSHIVDVDHSAENALADAKCLVENFASRIQLARQEIANGLTSQLDEKNEKIKKSQVKTDISDSDFMSLVDQAKHYIQKGDVFQVVLSRCFKRSYHCTPLEIYAALRKVSPSPYLFYFPLKDRVMVGASPETLVSVQDGKVTINPIAGTTRRSPELTLDEVEEKLLTDEKELAEHRMLVDLARNDLGRVCQPGSVQMVEYAQVKHFSHVSHIASVVDGVLREDRNALDALSSAFPAGTLSGAPKIRAMQIIDELERSKRGLYGGAVIRCDFQGNLDSCISIRMSVLKDGVATVRTGAGIVYDSNPALEAQETYQKASAMLEAIALAEGECL